MPSNGNILLVANWNSDVGYAWWLMENFWVEISQHFSSCGKDSYLIYPKVTQIPEAISRSEINVSECDFRDHSPGNIIKLHKLIKDNNIKYIYLSDSPSYSLFYLLLRIWGVKKIVVHDHTPGERTIAKSWRKLAKKIIQAIPLYTADHFVAVTSYVYQRLISVSCIPERKCSVASNGIRPISLENIDFMYANKIFNIPEDKVIVITTGRASYYKGIDFFIECANELVNKQELHQLHFIFCGDGPDLDEFKSLVNKYKLEDNFTFAGKRSDIREILPSCDVGFHAAVGEVGYSLSILEYMSAGLVTAVPDRPSTSQSTTDMVNGILYIPDNLESATKAIKVIFSEKKKALRENAVNTVKNEYNISDTNKKLVIILQNVFK